MLCHAIFKTVVISSTLTSELCIAPFPCLECGMEDDEHVKKVICVKCILTFLLGLRTEMKSDTRRSAVFLV